METAAARSGDSNLSGSPMETVAVHVEAMATTQDLIQGLCCTWN